MKKILIFLFFICFYLFSETWWNENWKYRVSFKIKNPYKLVLENIPVKIKGETLRKKTGLLKEKIATNSIRIIDEKNNEIPVQVDEKDNTGLYQQTGNGQLDNDDEIVFQINLNPDEEKKFYLYFTDKLAPLPEYSTDIKFKKTVFGEKNINYNAELSNSIISIGIRGPGKEKDSEGKLLYGGLGKASITSFKIKDKEIIYQGHSWGWNLLGGAYSSISNSLPWDDPEILIDSSVRKIVVCKAENIDKNFTEEFKNISWTLSGKVKGSYYRYFILYSKIPYCEMIETIKIESADPKYNCLYEFSWCPTYPRDWDNDKLYVPVAGKVITINFQDERNYQTKKAEEGWFAIANTKEKRGLALFFDKEKAEDIFADFYGPGLKREDILSHEWSKKYCHTGVRIFYRYNDFNLQPVRENKFGFYGITDEDGEKIGLIYKSIWEGIPVSFGFPEEKKE
jgi:hypothetical protein